MVNVPDKVRTLLNDPDAVKVIATASKDGTPHAIVVGSGMSPAPDLVVAGEVMMKTTSANLKANPKVGVLVAKGPEAYLVVAENPKLVKEGEIYDKMNEELSKMNLKARGVWMFTPSAVYDQSAGPNAGKKIA